MTKTPLIQWLGMISSIILPFFNIPLMMRIVKRRSSEDLSLIWVLGVFICLVGMMPAAWVSEDDVFRVFGVINLIFFSGVTFLVLYFRFK